MSIKYFIYARKSSEGEDRQMASIEDQVAEMKRLANQMDFHVVDIVSEARSAKEPGRVKFNDLLQRIEKGEAQGILAWKLNRLARNPIDGGKISWMLQQGIIQHIKTYGSEYKPEDNVLMMQVEFGMANQYVKDLSVDVKRGLRRKAERGWYPSTVLPVGYRHNPERKSMKDKEIICDKRNFQTVKKLWKLMLTGEYSVNEIKRKGDKLGLTNTFKTLLSLQAYFNMFGNEFYAGYFYWSDKDGNRVLFEGKHKPVVTKAQFARVQEIINGKSNFKRECSYVFPYRGLIKCGECGGHVTAEHKHQVICTGCKHKFSIKTKIKCPICGLGLHDMEAPSMIDKKYYHCTKNYGPCSQGSILEEDIEKEIKKQMKSISVPEKFAHWVMTGLEFYNQDFICRNTKLLTELKRHKTRLENKISQFIHMRANNEITLEEMTIAKSETQKALEDITVQMESLNNSFDDWKELAEEKLDFVVWGLEQFKKGDKNRKNTLTATLASNLVLKDKKLYITTRKLYQCVLDCYTSYYSRNECFEPEIPYGKQGVKSPYHKSFQELRTELETIRTCLLDIISNKAKSNRWKRN